MQRTLLRIVVAILVISLFVYLFAREITQVYGLHQENEKVKQEAQKLEKANADLIRKIELIQTDDSYKEKIIRQELGMIKKGEKVYRFQE